MPDDPAKDSGSESNGTQAPPVPAISKNSSDKPSSPAAPTIDVEALTVTLIEKLEPLIEKKVQSKQDKRLGPLDDFAPTLQQFKKYLDAAGQNVEEAARNMKIDQLLASPAGGGTSAQSGAQRTEVVSEKKVAEILNEAGVKFDDPDVTAWAGKDYLSAGDAYHELTKLTTRKLKQASNGSPAAAVFDGQSATPPGNKDDQKHKLYAEKARLQMNGHLHEKRLAEIDAELKRLG